MRIAICIWGLLRSLRYTIDSFERHVLSVLDRYEISYDIYVHTYNISGVYQSTRNHEKSVTLNISEWRLLQPNYIFIENQDEFDARINYQLFQTQGDPWHNDFSSFRNHMRALNSLYHVTQVVSLMHQQKAYDGIVFLRPDVKFVTDLPLQLLHHPQTMKEFDLFLPDFHRSCLGNEYNDRMALGKVYAALQYGRKFETAFEYSLSHRLHAEKITYYQLSRTLQPSTSSQNYQHNPSKSAAMLPIRVAEIPFRFQRIRSSGDIHIRDHEAVTPQRQEYLENHYNYFVGKGRRTPWIMRVLYTFLEIITFGQIYVWNHDDHGNVFCHPHPHIDYKTLQKFDRQFIMSQGLKSGTTSSTAKSVVVNHQSKPIGRKPGIQHIDCEYKVVPYTFTKNYAPIAANYVHVESCHFLSESDTVMKPSTLAKKQNHVITPQKEVVVTTTTAANNEETEEEYAHMPKKVYMNKNNRYNHSHTHHSGGNNHTAQQHLRSG